MSVEFRGTSNDTCNFYGKIKDEETVSSAGVSSMSWKTNVGTGRYNTILIGILIFLNLAVVALVIAELATTAPDGDDRQPLAQVGMLTSDSVTVQRLLEIAKGNRNLTMGVQKSLRQDFLAMMKSFYTLLGWKKSGNIFYKLVTDYRVSYASAKTRCRVKGGRLAAKIFRDPAAVKEMVANKIANHKDVSTYIWIGLNDLNAEGTWEWIDGGTSNNVTTDWWPGEPNQKGGNEDCGNLIGLTDRKILINDAPCYQSYYYMCEIVIPESMS